MTASPRFSVHAHRLIAQGSAVPFRQSPHGGAPLRPRYIVMHYTAGLSAASAVSWLTDPRAKASAHLVVDRDGRATQLMAFDRTCWHAGKSQWKGLQNLNGHSIGIEMVNAGKLAGKVVRNQDGWRSWAGEPVDPADVVVARHRNESAEAGWHRYTEAQIAAVIAIGQTLKATYGFAEMLGHDDISPGRKVDPGPAFPMARVAAAILTGEGRPTGTVI